MYLHDLVRKITLEVLHELQGRSSLPCVLVFADKDPQLAAQIRTALGEPVELVFYKELTAQHTPKRYIVPSLSCSAMAELAMGIATQEYMSLVLHYVLQGKEVEVLEFEYKSYAATAPYALYSLYAEHEKTLANLGVKQYKEKAPETVRLHDTLITERTVIQAHEGGSRAITVPATAIITPLAAEAASELNMTILKGV